MKLQRAYDKDMTENPLEGLGERLDAIERLNKERVNQNITSAPKEVIGLNQLPPHERPAHILKGLLINSRMRPPVR